MQSKATQLEQRIPELDGLRGIAALMVLVWHFTGSLIRPELGAWTNWVYAATIFGRTGVDLFFVLSGFLIIGILIDNRNAGNLFWVFYIRRICRIWPPYLLLITLFWACTIVTGPNAAFNAEPSLAVSLAGQFLFIWNWLMAFANGPIARGFSITWSVAIEEQFYLVFPAIVVFTPQRALAAVLATIAIASAAARPLVFAAFPTYDLLPYVATPLRLDCLCVGGLLALIWRDPIAMAWMKDRRRTVVVVLCVLLSAAPLMVHGVINNIFKTMYLWGHAYLALLFASAISAALLYRRERATAVLRIATLQSASRISYALYLLHPLFLSVVFICAKRQEAIWSLSDAGLAFMAAILTLLACTASYRWIEAPAIRYGHTFRYS